MQYNFYELMASFFFYSFVGWCVETVAAVAGRKKFANRGFLNGPLCPLYGYSIVFIFIFMGSLRENPVFLFIGSAIVASVFELLTGMILEKVTGRKWWDYSGHRFNLGGHICFLYSAIWGALATLTVLYVQPFLMDLLSLVPGILLTIVIWAGILIFAVDWLVVAGALVQLRKQSKRVRELAEGMQELADNMQKVSNRLNRTITSHVEKRMEKALGTLNVKVEVKEKPDVFAYGVCFSKLFWLFLLGAFGGDIIETLFCYVTTGRLMSRSSVVYGPFSIVWGLGIALFTLLLDRYKDKSDRYVFLFGTVIGGAYEYVCSVFTELVFGTVFWDYSKLPFNLGGRINLLYCFFWGVAAVVWLKICYPFLAGMIEKIPKKVGNILTVILVGFMIVNVIVSGLSLARYSTRAMGVLPANGLEQLLDDRFDDARMERIYPNAIIR